MTYVNYEMCVLNVVFFIFRDDLDNNVHRHRWRQLYEVFYFCAWTQSWEKNLHIFPSNLFDPFHVTVHKRCSFIYASLKPLLSKSIFMNCHAWSHERFQQSFRRNDATTTKRTAALKLNEMHADSSVAFAVYAERSQWQLFMLFGVRVDGQVAADKLNG